MNNTVVRALAGFVFCSMVIGAALLGQLTFGLLFLFFAGVGLYEMYELLKHKHSHAPRWFAGMSVGILLYLALFLIATETITSTWLWVFAPLIATIFCLELIKLDFEAVTHLALTAFGWLYVIVPLGLVNFLGVINGSYEYEIPIGFFLILWINDTGAYCAGKLLGRHKLYEKVSPNKTWEGLIGGIVFAFVLAYILSFYFIVLTLPQWMMVAFIISVFGNLGDLFESHLKRSFAVKDSGHLIPGHGGVLDRFDGLLLSLPVLICYFKIIQLI